MAGRAIGDLVIKCSLDVAKEVLESMVVLRSRIGSVASKSRDGVGYIGSGGKSKVVQLAYSACIWLILHVLEVLSRLRTHVLGKDQVGGHRSGD